MGKSKLTLQLEKEIQKEISNCFGCLEVTIGFFGNKRVDYITMDTKEVFRCFEIKISKSDFHSKHGHNFVGNYNYYVMPKELFNEIKEEIPKEIGVYAWNGTSLKLVKNPKKQQLKEDINILKNSMIRSLYRDACKISSSENVQLMNDLRRKLDKCEKENKENKRGYQKYKNAIYFELGREKFKEFQEKYDI